jgi:hypothetical protein
LRFHELTNMNTGLWESRFNEPHSDKQVVKRT